MWVRVKTTKGLRLFRADAGVLGRSALCQAVNRALLCSQPLGLVLSFELVTTPPHHNLGKLNV